MTLHLLRLVARHPLKSLGVALAAPLLVGLALVTRSSTPAASTAVAPADSPDLLARRLWLDSYPDAPTDKFSLWLFVDDGIGIFRKGSGFRFLIDVVEYDQKGDRLSVKILEENKKKETRYTIKSCNEKPPFDLCLTFENAPLGSAKFYGFKDSEQLARRLPWLEAEAARALPSRR